MSIAVADLGMKRNVMQRRCRESEGGDLPHFVSLNLTKIKGTDVSMPKIKKTKTNKQKTNKNTPQCRSIFATQYNVLQHLLFSRFNYELFSTSICLTYYILLFMLTLCK